MSLRLIILTVLAVLYVTGCASTPQPILSSGTHPQTGTRSAAASDVAACRAEAEAAGIDPSRSDSGITVPNIVKRTAGNAAIGGATGAATGAIFGGNPARGAGVGAVSGAMWTALSELLYGNLFSGAKSRPAAPNLDYTRFMNRCLATRGHNVTGWK
jgi:outer membrane murein-binding lipoprotein Lpp